MLSEQPDISLVIPAWNEEAYLPRLLDSVDAARSIYAPGADRIEVIVADNGSTDATAAIAEARGCRVQPVERRRIAALRNGGAAVTRGNVVAFADADFRIHPETFNYIRAVMQRPEFIGGATGLTMERWSLGIAVTWYLIMPPLWLLQMDGGVWFCRREDFFEVGGFDESRPMGEDVAFMRRLHRLGRSRQPRQQFATHFTAKRLGLHDPLVLNSSRKWDQHGDWHMLTYAAKAVYLLLRRRGVGAHAQRYWYEGR